MNDGGSIKSLPPIVVETRSLKHFANFIEIWAKLDFVKTSHDGPEAVAGGVVVGRGELA